MGCAASASSSSSNACVEAAAMATMAPLNRCKAAGHDVGLHNARKHGDTGQLSQISRKALCHHAVTQCTSTTTGSSVTQHHRGQIQMVPTRADHHEGDMCVSLGSPGFPRWIKVESFPKPAGYLRNSAGSTFSRHQYAVRCRCTLLHRCAPRHCGSIGLI